MILKIKTYMFFPIFSLCLWSIQLTAQSEVVARGLQSSTEQTAEMIILTHDLFYSNMEIFAEHKNRRGIRTKIIRLSEIGVFPEAEEIKAYIHQFIDFNDSVPTYLLLVGNIYLLPAFRGINNALNDHEYSTPDSSDYFPRIMVGRFPVNSVEESELYVRKTIAYENEARNSDSLQWCKAASIAASNAHLDDMHGRHLVSVVRNKNFDPVDDFRVANQSFTGNNITSAVNEGRSWLFYLGLGDATSWYVTGGFNTNSISNSINNSGKLPAIISVGCRTAALDHPAGDCLGERWMNLGIDKGAILFIGATENTAFFLSDTLGKHTFLSYLNDGSETVGEALVYGKMKMYESFKVSFSDTAIREAMQHFLLLGDPSLMPWTEVPEETEVSLNIEADKNLLLVSVKANGLPVKRALISLSDDSFGIHQTAYSDALGQYRFLVDTDDSTRLYLSVIGKNLKSFRREFRLNDLLSLTENKVLIYPNPVGQYLTIQSSEDANAVVYNSRGQIVGSIKLIKGINTIDSKSLSTGVYSIRIAFEHEVVSKRFIKIDRYR